MAEQDLRNTSFYKELLQTAKEQGVITLLDIVAEMKKHKDAPSDLDKVIEVTRSACQSCRTVLKTPAPRIELGTLSASPEITVWCWVDSRAYSDALFEVNRAVYDAYGKAGIRIPCDRIAIAQGATAKRRSPSRTRTTSRTTAKKSGGAK